MSLNVSNLTGDCRSSQETHTNKSKLRNTRVYGIATPTHSVLSGGTPRARRRSPAGSDRAVRTLGSSSEDAISEADDVGHETQALLNASRAMLVSCRHPSQAAPSPPKGNRPREPDSTHFTVDQRTASSSKDGDVMLALFSIAREYRFLRDEVVEEYEELGQDVDATRSYFREIRDCINEKKSMRNKFTN